MLYTFLKFSFGLIRGITRELKWHQGVLTTPSTPPLFQHKNVVQQAIMVTVAI